MRGIKSHRHALFWIVDRVKQKNVPDLMETREQKPSQLFHETSLLSSEEFFILDLRMVNVNGL